MTELIGTRLGDFEIVRELGRGGMGVVYEARQISLNRRVALKVLSSSLGLSTKSIQRFRREAEAAAKLHHTNIVPVYATGEEDGTHFYAMELIDGPSLDHVIRQQRKQAVGRAAQPDHESQGGRPDAPGRARQPDLRAEALDATGPFIPGSDPSSPTSALSSSSLGPGSGYFDSVARMIAEVADALEYAHQQGVIHRDIKPSNLLLSPADQLSVNDFGLARMLEQPGMTMTGEFVGTPAYMSPEQITAGRTPLDHRTDIYSLGATLYELLTLQPPFRGERRDQVLAQILHKEPKAPRKINNKVPVDLETICLKALEKDPDRRYPTAGALAEDLRRYVNRFAILAKRAGLLTRTKKWIARHPAVAALAGCLLVALLTAGFFAYQAKRDRDQLRGEQRQAAVERAILEAQSGETAVALEAIADAENRGAEPGRLNLLRGLVEIHRGKSKEALVYLEQAERQLPDSVAVKALQAKALLDDGQFHRFDEIYTQLEEATPRTPEDHLFLALIQAEMDPVVALRTLDAMPARSRKAPVVRLARASAQTMLPFVSGRAEDAEQALEELRRVDLPDDHPLLLNMRMFADLAAAQFYEVADPRRAAVLKQAAQDAKRLGRYRDNPLLVLARGRYYHFVGDDKRLMELIQQAKKDHTETPFLIDLEAHVLYRRGHYEEALRAMRASSSAGYEPLRKFQEGIVLLSIPGKRAEAEEAFNYGLRSRKRGIALALLPAYLQLLGPEYLAKSQQVAVDVRQRSADLVTKMQNGWYHHLLAFHARDRRRGIAPQSRRQPEQTMRGELFHWLEPLGGG